MLESAWPLPVGAVGIATFFALAVLQARGTVGAARFRSTVCEPDQQLWGDDINIADFA